jgi:hypothetical protein
MLTRPGSNSARLAASQIPILLIPIVLYINHRILADPTVFPHFARALGLGRDSIIPSDIPNPFEAFLFVSHPSPPGSAQMELAKNAAFGHVGTNGAGVPGQTYMRGWKVRGSIDIRRLYRHIDSPWPHQDILFILYHIVFWSL